MRYRNCVPEEAKELLLLPTIGSSLEDAISDLIPVLEGKASLPVQVFVKCLTCGKVVKKPRAELAKKFRRKNPKSWDLFCSVQCSGKSLKRERKCLVCGTKLLSGASKYRKYCDDCRDKTTFRTLRPRKCVFCGKEFRPKTFQSSTCGKECANALHSRRMRGERNTKFRGGHSPYTVLYYKMRPFILERDGFMCQMCGVSEQDSGRELSVHHIDRSKENNAPANLISLCQSCHTKLHRSKQFETLSRKLLKKSKENFRFLTSKSREIIISLQKEY